MGAVPWGKVGVGSAVNDVTRLVSGALSVAVIGSTMYSIYSSRVADALAALPTEAAEAAKDSVGAAVQIAASLPGEAGPALAAAARDAFTDAFGLAMLMGAGISLVGAVLVAKFMPARDVAIDGQSNRQDLRPAEGSPLGEAAPEAVPVRTDK